MSAVERLTIELSQATRPVCEYGHRGLSVNAAEGRPECPVPEHTPQRVIDLEDASVVWESEDYQDAHTSLRPVEEVLG